MFFIIGVAIRSIILVASPFACASNPDKLQDFCVAIKDSEANVFVNGKICRNIREVNADDFYLQAQLNIPRNTSNRLGYKPTPIVVDNLPGLNTLGVAIGRVDLGPYGLSPPHFHPLGSEVFVVFEGTIYAGFIDSRNKLYAKTLRPGDIFVVPQGLIHFMYNTGGSNAVTFEAFGTENPYPINTLEKLFGSDPPILPQVLNKEFLLDNDVISRLISKFHSESPK
ncbi:unnamed protein product [Cuscuta epithymum]|uniref:Germin-like protein n=1 Tax=Cuscuta epithymum TaxID=186058 RepID=A0AAV0GCW1_9ASTE|nr:unnamed protein product [Cuscuta epithymum]